jgi:hypothetical protein
MCDLVGESAMLVWAIFFNMCYFENVFPNHARSEKKKKKLLLVFVESWNDR